MPTRDDNVDRRQLLKSSVACAAAIGSGLVQGRKAKGCPVTFDKDGKKVEWWCIVDVIDRIPHAWLYLWENCKTGRTVEEWDQPYLSTGDCRNVKKAGRSCVRGSIISQYERVNLGDREMLISPHLSPSVRTQVLRLLRS